MEEKSTEKTFSEVMAAGLAITYTKAIDQYEEENREVEDEHSDRA